jgi:hypothetical protein
MTATCPATGLPCGHPASDGWRCHHEGQPGPDSDDSRPPCGEGQDPQTERGAA